MLLSAASSVPLVSSPSVCACVKQDSSKDCRRKQELCQAHVWLVLITHVALPSCVYVA